jgi:uncharacterized glyoxalase superfamily protein PhnB
MAKKVKPIPEGYHTMSAYLIVKNGAKAIDFYKKAFGAKVLTVCEGEKGKIMHAELQIGDSIFMLSDEYKGKDGCGVLSPKSLKGTSVMLHLYVKDVDKAFAQAVKSGAKVLRPLADMFWGDLYGQVEDPFGHQWSLATHIEDLTDDEINERACEFFSKKP